MSQFLEEEYKILNVNVVNVCKILDSLGAKKVYEGPRMFTYFDKEGHLRLTQEGTFKLSYSHDTPEGHEVIKVKVSRDTEMMAILKQLGYVPVARMPSKRISYELNEVDFDIDQFPEITPFMEIDCKKKDLRKWLEKLNLANNEVVQLTTTQIYKRNGIDVFEKYKI